MNCDPELRQRLLRWLDELDSLIASYSPDAEMDPVAKIELQRAEDMRKGGLLLAVRLGLLTWREFLNRE